MKKLIRCANQYIWESDWKTIGLLNSVSCPWASASAWQCRRKRKKDGPQSRLFCPLS